MLVSRPSGHALLISNSETRSLESVERVATSYELAAGSRVAVSRSRELLKRTYLGVSADDCSHTDVTLPSEGKNAALAECANAMIERHGEQAAEIAQVLANAHFKLGERQAG